jgi:hypothetical protein
VNFSEKYCGNNQFIQSFDEIHKLRRGSHKFTTNFTQNLCVRIGTQICVVETQEFLVYTVFTRVALKSLKSSKPLDVQVKLYLMYVFANFFMLFVLFTNSIEYLTISFFKKAKQPKNEFVFLL